MTIELYSPELREKRVFEKEHALNLLIRNQKRTVKTWELPETSKMEFRNGDLVRKSSTKPSKKAKQTGQASSGS